MQNNISSLNLVEQAFKKQKTPRIPVNHRGFSAKAAAYVLKREVFLGGAALQFREVKSLFEGWHDEFLERSFNDAVEIARITGQDLLRVNFWRYNNKPTKKLDENTYLFEYGREEDWRIFHYIPEVEQARIDYYRPRRIVFEDLAGMVKEREKKLASYNPADEQAAIPFILKAHQLYGQEKAIEARGVADLGILVGEGADAWLEAMFLDPGLVKAHINLQVELGRKNVEFLAKQGLKYIFGGMDMASEQGPMYSPAMFNELVLPGLKSISALCHKHECHYMFASDGNLWPVAGGLFGESGIDGYYEVDRKAGMDLDRLRTEYPGLTLVGNISSWTLANGTEGDIRREVESCFDSARKHSGIIVGTSNFVLPETEEKKIDVLLEAVEKYR